jgi:YbgC/YbaW family acyl-CoA thioester hydrolase
MHTAIAEQPAVRPLVTVHRPVEHCDTDSYGVVHFSRYPAVMETAALKVLEELGAGLEHLRHGGIELRVRELKVRYKAAARYGDILLMQAELGHVAPAHVRVVVQAYLDTPNGRELVAEAELNIVFVDATTGRPTAIPQVLAVWEVNL